MREARKELATIQDQLTETQWNLAQIILEIPSGRIATYGCLAEIHERRHGQALVPVMVGKTRVRLYELLTHDTHVPLHRVATQDDLYSEQDSSYTRWCNMKLRHEEGTYDGHDPWWWGA